MAAAIFPVINKWCRQLYCHDNCVRNTDRCLIDNIASYDSG